MTFKVVCTYMKNLCIHNVYRYTNRGVRSRTAEGAYAPPVSKQVGHMPYL